MYHLETTDYGYRITSTGEVDLDEVLRMKEELLATFAAHDGPFSIVVDARRRIPLDGRTVQAIEELHKAARRSGVRRAAIIVDSPVVKAQELQIGHSSHTDGIDRIIDAGRTPDWEKQAIAWAAHGIEPHDSSDNPVDTEITWISKNVYD
jgi:hypothetical protein